MRESFPLQWPDGWPRTKSPARARFKVSSFALARDRVLHEVSLLGGANPVIASNLPTRQDGLPYAAARDPADPGIAVYWLQDGGERVMACDRWDRIRDNLHAVELSLQALRGLDRWGSSAIVERAFSGFAALPPARTEHWRAVFGIPPSAIVTMGAVKAVYHNLARSAHPDIGGTDAGMQRLNAAVAAAEKELAP